MRFSNAIARITARGGKLSASTQAALKKKIENLRDQETSLRETLSYIDQYSKLLYMYGIYPYDEVVTEDVMKSLVDRFSNIQPRFGRSQRSLQKVLENLEAKFPDGTPADRPDNGERISF